MASLPEHVVPPGMKRIEQHRQSASDGAIHEVGAPGDDVVAPKHEARDEEIGELYTRINFLEEEVKRLEREKQDEASKHERETKEFNAIILAKEKKLKEGTIRYQTEIVELLSRILEVGRELEEKKSELREQCENIKLVEIEKYIWKKRAIDRKKDLLKLMKQTGRFLEEREKLKQEKANIVEILKKQTEFHERKILQLEGKILSGTVARSCIQMGYSREMVMRAFQIFNESQATTECITRILMGMVEEEPEGAVGGQGRTGQKESLNEGDELI